MQFNAIMKMRIFSQSILIHFVQLNCQRYCANGTRSAENDRVCSDYTIPSVRSTFKREDNQKIAQRTIIVRMADRKINANTHFFDAFVVAVAIHVDSVIALAAGTHLKTSHRKNSQTP